MSHAPNPAGDCCHLASVLSLLSLGTGSADAARQGTHSRRVCAAAAAGEAACLALQAVTATGAAVNPMAASDAASPNAATAISGKTPTDIRSAYGLGNATSGGRTVAIVDAFGYPNAERDLGVYRAQFALSTRTRANGCLRIVNQSGGTSLPRFNLGWSQEQALDLDAVSAACESCKILLVQSTSASISSLGAAVNTAARLGASAISNSYGGGDIRDTSAGGFSNHPGIAVTASTGDSGYQGGSFPASSHYVTAVGGTSLVGSATTGVWSETVWSGAGSGCTTLNAAPAGQNDVGTGCTGRAIADVSAVADPATGLAVYAPTSRSVSSWAQYGGTSLSSPIIASVYAQGPQPGATVYANTPPYAHIASLHDVTSGRNGTCPVTQWCTARAGWDGPSGLGTPNGVVAF